MAKEGNSARRAIGRGLVSFMPKLLAALALIGTAAMLWVGGQIFLHGLDEYHIGNIGHGLHDFAHSVAGNLPGAGVWEWLINAGGAGVFGLILGGLIVGVLHRSEEHTSELQSLMRISYAVFCLKKKNYY